MEFKSSLAAWKRELNIAAGWINTPFLFLTFATVLYGVTSSSLPYWLFILVGAAIIIPVYKILGAILIRSGYYKAERTFDARIDPLQDRTFSNKEVLLNEVNIPTTILSIQLQKDFLLWVEKRFGDRVLGEEESKLCDSLIRRYREIEKLIQEGKIR